MGEDFIKISRSRNIPEYSAVGDGRVPGVTMEKRLWRDEARPNLFENPTVKRLQGRA